MKHHSAFSTYICKLHRFACRTQIEPATLIHHQRSPRCKHIHGVTSQNKRTSTHHHGTAVLFHAPIQAQITCAFLVQLARTFNTCVNCNSITIGIKDGRTDHLHDAPPGSNTEIRSRSNCTIAQFYSIVRSKTADTTTADINRRTIQDETISIVRGATEQNALQISLTCERLKTASRIPPHVETGPQSRDFTTIEY